MKTIFCVRKQKQVQIAGIAKLNIKSCRHHTIFKMKNNAVKTMQISFQKNLKHIAIVKVARKQLTQT